MSIVDFRFEEEDEYAFAAHDLIRGVSRVLLGQCLEGTENFESLVSSGDRLKKMVELQLMMEEFTSHLWEAADCANAAFVVACTYICRLNGTHFKLSFKNVQLYFATALVIAIKTLEDAVFSNREYSEMFGLGSVEILNRAEERFLLMLRYELNMRPSDYEEIKLFLLERSYEIEGIDEIQSPLETP